MTKKTGMTEKELLALISSMKKSGINAEGGDLSMTRQEILSRYLGEKYGDERKGLSSVTTREVLETVEWALPSLMRIFAGDDLIVAFEPIGSEDEEAAKQETEYLNHIFKKENDGFLILYSFIKDALLSPNAYCKVWHDESEEVTTERYTGLLEQDLVALDEDDELEPISQEETLEMRLIFDPTQNIEIEVEVPVFDVEYKRTRTVGRDRVESVPQEELIISGNITGLDLSKADFICHTTEKSKSDLLAMGFDKAVVDKLKSPERADNSEADNRKTYTDEDSNEPTVDMLELEESYILVDWEKNDKAERRRVLSVGGTVLSNEPDDYIPFVSMSSILIPHKHIGMAFAELVVDLQKIKTVLTRQMLNNLYRVNNPRPIVGLGVNMQDLLNDAPNAPIRARDINDIRMEPTQAVIGQVLPTLQHFNDMQASRTGVSANTMGVDPGALAETTRGAYLGNLEQANQRLEMLARIFAETGIKQIFLKLHELTLRHQADLVQYKTRGEWVQLNPTEWKSRKNMSVVVGIGYGTKEQTLTALGQVKESQRELAMAGSPLVNDQNIFNLLSKQAELANTGDPEKYFTDPSKMTEEQKNPPPQEDPLAAAQMKLAEVEEQKVQLQHQRDMFTLEQKNADLERQNIELTGKFMAESKKLDQGDRKLDQEDRKIDLDETKALVDAEYKSDQIDVQKLQMEGRDDENDRGER